MKSILLALRKNYVLLLLSIGLFVSFIFFSYLVHRNLFTNFDFNTTVKLQDRVTPHERFALKVDQIFSTFSDIGNFEVMTTILVILLLFRRKLLGFIYLFFFFFFHLFEIYGKTFVDHPPPPAFMIRVDHPINVPKFEVRSEFSYPSGHAGRTTFVSLLLIFLILKSKRLSKWQKYLFIALIVVFDIIMFISRPYLGEHWTSDVIGGILLGAALALLSEAFFYDHSSKLSVRNSA